tara:strand:- start:417 stop:1424 length:1008 start_codon:yes stop_codon:yes gene_type:complete
MKSKYLLLISAIFIALLSMYVSVLRADESTIRVYSERQPFLIEPLINEYEKISGNKIEWIFSKKGLVQKTILEKENPIADIFLSADIARLIDISEAEASVGIPFQNKVPKHLQTQDWTSLTMRARIIYAHDDLDISEISYEDLILPEYEGRVCTRSGFHPYNVSLFSALISHHGQEWFEDYIVKLRKNLARKPQGNDRDQVKAIYAGVCDLSIGNHYYYFKMLDDPNQKKWLEKVSPIFPNQNSYGSHVNISGLAIVSNKNYDASVDFLDFLLSDNAQTIYANDNNEFPVNPNVSASNKVLKLLDNAKFDTLDLQEISSNRRAVLDILRKINFDG